MASSGPANDQDAARQTWISGYPFEPYNGGQGATLAVSTVNATVALVGGQPTANTNSILINNTGSNWAFVQWGSSTVAATTSSLAIPPGASAIFSIRNIGTVFPTTLAAITASGATTLQVTLGYGGN